MMPARRAPLELLMQSRDHPAALSSDHSLYLKGYILQIFNPKNAKKRLPSTDGRRWTVKKLTLFDKGLRLDCAHNFAPEAQNSTSEAISMFPVGGAAG